MMSYKGFRVVRVNPSWKVQKMITVGRTDRVLDTKYKRYYLKKRSLIAHYPSHQVPRIGQQVTLHDCKPLSARKRHIAWLRKY